MGVGVRSHTKCVSAAPCACAFFRRSVSYCLLLIVFLPFLTACSLPDIGDFLEKRSQARAAPAPAPIPLPPTDASQSEIPAVPRPMDSFRALAPSEGLKFTPLFAQNVSDTDTRFGRVEREVQNLRNDFDTVVPSLVRLVAVEQDMKELIGQLQTLTSTSQLVDAGPSDIPLPPPVPNITEPPPQAFVIPPTTQEQLVQDSPAPSPVIPGEDIAGGTEPSSDAAAAAEDEGPIALTSPVTPEAAPKGHLPPEGAASPYSPTLKPEAPPPPAAAEQEVAPDDTKAQGSVMSVRVGDHLDKTRIVLDLTTGAESIASIADNGKTLVIKIPGMDWSRIKPYEAMQAELVAGYHVEGDSLIVDLLYPARLKEQGAGGGASDSSYHQLVIDLFSAYVHQ